MKGDQEKVQAILGRRIEEKREMRHEIERRHKEMWDTAATTRRTYHFLPVLAEIPNQFSPSPGLVQYLTGHGPYPAYLSRFNLRENDQCECGKIGTSCSVPVQPDTQCRRGKETAEWKRNKTGTRRRRPV